MKTISCSQSTYDKISAHAKKMDCGLGKALDNIFRQEVSNAENKADLSAEAVATTPQTHSESPPDDSIKPKQQKEAIAMEAQDNCPGCHKKELDLLEQRHKLEKAEEAAAAEREKNQSLDAALKAAQEKAPEMIDPFEHYKTCKEPDCAITKGFNALIANAQSPESLTSEQVKTAMKHHKIFEGPERIVITGIGGAKKK